MRNRKIIRTGLFLLGIVAVLLVGRPWKSFRGSHGFEPLRSREGIDRIVLSSPTADSIVLLVNEGKWMLGGEEPVNAVALENLLFAAEKMEVSSMISQDEAGKGPWNEAAFFHGKQQVYGFSFRSENDRFQVKMEEKGKICFTSMPGFPDLNLVKVFSLNPGHYREHLLINLLPSEVRCVEVERAGGESYRFERDDKGVIHGYSGKSGTTLPKGEPDSLATALLFSYFSGIVYEEASPYRVEEVLGDSIRFPWLGTVHVVARNGEEHRLRIYSYLKDLSSQPHMFKALVVHDGHPFALVVNYIYLDVLIRGSDHYFGKK